MKNSMQVIDDVLPRFLFDRLEQKIFSKHLFLFNQSMDGSETEYAFSCLVSNEAGVLNPEVFEDCLNILQFSCDKAGVIPNGVIRTRFFLQTPFVFDPETTVHVDYETEHMVCLFYLTDADTPKAETTIYNTDLSVLGKVSPKKNRAVIFDGMLPHSAGHPREAHRLVCNINFHRQRYVK